MLKNFVKIFVCRLLSAGANGITAMLICLSSLAATGNVEAANDAAFVSQTIPTTMTAGETYTISVTMKNSGTTSWTVAGKYFLTNLVSAGWNVNTITVGTTIAANGQRGFSATVTAPSTPGTYGMQWQMEQQGVGFFGATSTYVPITVVARQNNAEFSAQSTPTTITAGASLVWSVTMKNTGNTTWKAGKHVLAIQPPGSTKWGITTMAVTTDVAPGALKSFGGTIVGPAQLTYHDLQWQMQEVGGGFFGEPSDVRTLAVMGPAPAVSIQTPTASDTFIANAGALTVPIKAVATPSGLATVSKFQVLFYDIYATPQAYKEITSVTAAELDTTISIASSLANYVVVKATDSFNKYTQVAVPIKFIVDNSTVVSHTVPTPMVPNLTYNLSITMKNTGGTAWDPQNVELVEQSAADWGISTIPLATSVAPNGTAVFNATLTAPPTAGTYYSTWRLREKTRSLFGAIASAAVTVARPLPTVTMALPTANQSFDVPTEGTAQVPVKGSAVPGQAATIAKIDVLDGVTVVATVAGDTIDQSIPLAPGTHSIKLRATDNWGIVNNTAAVTVTVKANDAAYVSQSVAATMQVGKPYTATVTMRNSGLKPWVPSSGYALGAQNADGSTTWGARIAPTTTVNPGVQYAFSIPITAPSTPGTYNFQWKMLLENGEWFGDVTPNVLVKVNPVAPTVGALLAPLATDKFITTGGKATVPLKGTAIAGEGASIAKLEVLDGNVIIATADSGAMDTTVQLLPGSHVLRLRATDNFGQLVTSSVTTTINVLSNASTYYSRQVPATMEAGKSYQISVSMRNSGTATWSTEDGYSLAAYQGNTIWSVDKVSLAGPVVTNGIATFTFNVIAPADPGSYDFQWQMQREGFEYFGAVSPNTATYKITVTGAPPMVTLNNPAMGSTFYALDGVANVPVQGNAAAIGSAYILKVELLDGETLNNVVLGGVFNKTTGLSPGAHTLKLRALDSRGATSLSNSVDVNVLNTSAAFVNYSVPSSMVGGDKYSVSVTMRNTGTTTWQPSSIVLNSARLSDWGLAAPVPLVAAVAPGEQTSFTFDVIAPINAGTYIFQWRLTDLARGDFGASSTYTQIAVSAPPVPSAELFASPANVRVAPGQSANIHLTGSGKEPSGEITKLEVFIDSGAGYSQTAAKVISGSGVNVALDEALNLANGSYRIKLRVTDSRGRSAESQPVLVNVTDSPLLGTVSGVRSTDDLKTQLVGWVCRDTSAEALNYDVYVNAPPGLGGVMIAAGTANIGTEGDDASVHATCHTPGVSHHFVADLTAVRAQYPGSPLYVQARAANGDRIVLPCADYSCTMPDGMRIGLTSPNVNDMDRYRLPSPVFLRAQVTGNSGPVDEVAFNVNGTWVTAVSEGASAYSVSKSDIPASNTPYPVYAQVRQGNVTLISQERLFYVDPAMAPSQVSPASGTIVGLSYPTILSTRLEEAIQPGQSVKFFIDGPIAQSGLLKRAAAPTPAQEIGTATGNGNVWSYSWSPRQEGSYDIVAKVLDSAGNVLMQTPRSNMAVSAAMNPSSPTPMPVVIDFMAPTGSPNAGTLPGELGVSAEGAATYSIPLAIPPGTAGMQPNLSLNYSSNGGNGLLGMGWSLSGMSVIHRCAKTIATDGVPSRINFDDSDRLCLDGQRLLLANVQPMGTDQASLDAAYWTPSATLEGATRFRTEIESFAVITRLPGGGYRVESKDGRTYYYGTSANSAMVAQGRSDGKQLVWPHARTEDHVGNYLDVEYFYDGSTGEYVPKQIRYGGNTPAGQVADLAVRFTYEARDDAQVQYIGGSRSDMRQRLTHVSTYLNTQSDGTGGTLVRDYALNYAYSQGSGRSLVDSVKICADLAQTDCLPETKFKWGQGSVAYRQQTSLAAPSIDDRPYDAWGLNPLVYTGDIDGSGAISVIAAEQVYTNCPDVCNTQAEYDKALSGKIRVRLHTGELVDRVLRMPFAGIDATAMLVGDLNGDGRDDLVLVNEASQLTVTGYCLNRVDTDGSVKFDCQSWTEGTGVRPALVELNHDRKQHVMFGPGKDCVYQGGQMSCSSRNVVAPDVPLNSPFFSPVALDLSKQDRSDFYSVWKDVQPQRPNDPDSQGVSVCWNRQSIECQNIYSAVRGAAQLPTLTGVDSVGDLNGDGLTDFAYQISGDATPANNGLFLCLSKENGVDCARVRDSSSAQAKIAIGDFLGDGQVRLLIMQGYGSGSSSELCSYVNAQLNCQSITQPSLWQPELFGDVDGNGVLTIAHSSILPGGNAVPLYTLASDPAQDKLIGVTNGVGLRQEVDYARSDDAAVYRRAALIGGVEQRLSYPMVASPAGVMVKQLRLSNGQYDWLRTNYHYEGMAADAQRPGSGGFALMRVDDLQYGLSNESLLAQSYPYVGMVQHSRQYSGSCSLNEVDNTFNVVNTALTGGAVSPYPFVQSTVAQRKDLDCSDIGKVTTTNEYTDGWGNLNVQTTNAFSDPGNVYTTKTVTAFKTTHVTLSGLPTRVDVTKTTPSGVSNTRTASYTYNDGNGLRESETIEPDRPELKVTTTYDRSGNKFGLVNKEIQSWMNPACADVNWPETGCVTNQTRVVSDTNYDGKGRFPLSIVSAEGLTESRTYDPGSGTQLTSTDANNLTTTWGIDNFGRVASVLQPNGNQTRMIWKLCAGDCPGGASTLRVTERFHGSERIAVPEVDFIDSAGHVVRHQSWGFDGKAIVSDAAYDSLGRLATSYHPRHDPAQSYVERVFGYDALNRVTSVTTYDEGNNAVTATTSFKGLERVLANGKTTNGREQRRVESRDVLGQLTQVTDANDGVTKFDYDAFGNLVRTTDPGSHIIEVDYDPLGRKKELRDPDLGKIEYAVNPLGQVWRQISPNQRAAGKASYFAFDMLGRMTARYESDLTSRWTYDTATMGKGQLAEAYTLKGSQKDYRRVLSYDALGRPQQTTLYLTDNVYSSTTEFDGWGRLIRQIYQRGTDAEKRFETRYNGAGYLSSIERGGLKLWQVSEQDAANRPTTVVLGNGLLQKRTFNEFSGRLTNAQLVGTGTPLLQEGYGYDVLGNVTQRTQYWAGTSGFEERFDYDILNRLYSSTIGDDVRTFTYSADGNVRTKTGVGTGAYEYNQGDPARPHAVKSIAGVAGAFVYDDNGNLKSGNGRSMSWTSFDMPSQITKDLQWSRFTYGPEHQRTRQDRNGNAWTVYAGAQEVESVDGEVTVKTYWPNGIGVEIDNSGAVSELRWTHVDRLGSIVAISKADGSLVEPLAYDAWGKRRMLTNQDTPDNIDGAIDNKGYTGHEMLDQLELVHMNGRVYDPHTARFLSGDPLVQDPTNGQNFSRYTYVLNNPTNYTDPSGFETAYTVKVTRPMESADRWKVDDYARRMLYDLQARGALAWSETRSAISRIPVRPVVKVASRFLLVNGGRVAGGAVGTVVSAGCDILTAGGCAPANPVIVAGGVLAGTALGIKGAAIVAEALDANADNSSSTNSGGKDGTKVEPPVPGATEGEKTGGGTRTWTKPGGFDEANKDFDKMNPSNVGDKGNGVRVGTLEDGRRVVVRPDSSDGRPTIEIQRPDGKRAGDKIRYD